MSDDPHNPALPAVVTATVTNKAPIPEDFSVPRLVALARDLAMDMYEEAILLKKHDVTPAQYATLKDLPYFKQVVQNMSEEWNAPKNAQQRLAVQSAVGLEEVLPEIIARTKVKNEQLAGVAQIVKVLADIAGATNKAPQPTAAGEKFKITIDLGGGQEVYEKSRPTVTIEAGAPAESPAPVQPLTEGFGALLSLQPKPEPA